MKDRKYLIGLLTGVAITLAIAVIISFNQPQLVLGESGPGHAGHITAVTAQIQANQDILYVIDSQQEVIMAYIVYGAWGGSARSQKKLEFLGARSFKWDRKIPEAFNGTGIDVPSVKQQIIKIMEVEELGDDAKKTRRRR